MAGKRRARIDSATEAVRVMAKATAVLEPPKNVPLEVDDLPFFESVIAEFARSEWTAHQLEIAALLARTMADLTREQQLLRDEGGVSYSEKGTPVANPRKAIVQMHASSILSFRRSLALHARGQGGEARDTAKRREAARKIEGDNPLEDDLLARPE
ncbi:terminase small subunit [Devosia elaeis]|uniref:Terminase small subunit n=1 Tax=Devosia elaeis TaxID=1770058 RepID=A0A178I0B3_9HYPH|nr:terminase small subunit [Devosia elaeis]OAM77726.1 terminase small subunit [Devosia elaeis]